MEQTTGPFSLKTAISCAAGDAEGQRRKATMCLEQLWAGKVWLRGPRRSPPNTLYRPGKQGPPCAAWQCWQHRRTDSHTAPRPTLRLALCLKHRPLSRHSPAPRPPAPHYEASEPLHSSVSRLPRAFNPACGRQADRHGQGKGQGQTHSGSPDAPSFPFRVAASGSCEV